MVFRVSHDLVRGNRMLFSTDAAEIEVDPQLCFTSSEANYSPTWHYDGNVQFQRHLVRLVSELKTEGEEFECAVFLDQLSGVKCWLRNLDRRPESSVWLQTSTDRFYPDFVALLSDWRILVVEYKGHHLWSNDDSKQKRAIGNLSASHNDGRCIFVMPDGPDWAAIDAAIQRGVT